MWSHKKQAEMRRAPRALWMVWIWAAWLTGCGACEGPPGSGGQTPDASADQAEEMSSTEMGGSDDMHDRMDASPDATADDSGGDMDVDGDPDLTVDRSPPVVMISSSMLADPQGNYLLEGSARDDRGVTQLTYRVGSGAAQALALEGDRFEVMVTLPVDPSEIVVEATDEAGNRGEARVTVQFESSSGLSASFEVEGMPWLDEPLIFDASSSMDTEGQNLTFHWDFGDMMTATGERVGHVYRASGARTVRLTARAEDGREAIATRELVILDEPVPMGGALLEGLVLDDDGNALMGVEVLGRTGAVLARTDSTGRYAFMADRAVPVTLRFRKEGWLTQYSRIRIPVELETWRHDTSMRRVAEQVVVEDVSQENIVSLSSGVRIVFPENAFVDAQGDTVVGQINLSITPITPVNGYAAGFPGGYDALGDNMLPTALLTHGAVHVELEQAGERIQLAPGVTATLDIPMGTTAAVGSQIDLWSLDERSGLWIKEGVGEVIANTRRSNERAMRATVSHFSFWNVDEPIPLSTLNLLMDWGDTEVPDTFTTRVSTRQTQGGGYESQRNVSTIRVPNSSLSESAINTPRDVDTELEGFATQGAECLYFYEELSAPGANQPPTLEVQVLDLGSDDATAVEWGVTQTFTVNPEVEGQKRYFLRYPDTIGRFVRATVTSRSNARAQVRFLEGCTGATAHTIFLPPNQANLSRVIGPGKDDTRGIMIVAQQAGQVDIKLDLVEVPNKPPAELNQVVDLRWEDTSTQEIMVYLNKGEILHMALRGEHPTSVSASLVDAISVGRSWSNAPSFTPTSRTFTTVYTGWHRILLQALSAPQTPRDYAVVLGEVLPERTLTYRQEYRATALEDSVRTLRVGDVHRFRVTKGAQQAFYVSPVLAHGASGTQPKLNSNLSSGSVIPTDGTLQSYAGAAPTSQSASYTFSVLDPALEQTDYQLRTDMLNTGDTLRAGDESCFMAHTLYLALAGLAIREGGTIEVCSGEHNVFSGLILNAAGIRLKGLGATPQDTVLRVWDGRNPLQSNQRVTELHNMSFELNRAALTINYNTTAHGPFVAKDLYLSGLGSATSNAFGLLSPVSLSFEPLTSPPLLESVTIDAVTTEGLRVENQHGIQVRDLHVRNAYKLGASFSGTSYGLFEDITIEGAETGLLLTGGVSHSNTIRRVHVSDFSDPRIVGSASIGVHVLSGFASGQTQSQHPPTRISDVVVDLSLSGQRGIRLFGSSAAPSTFHIERCMVRGAGAGWYGLDVQPSTAQGNELRVVNSIFADTVQNAIVVNNASRFSNVELWHNTLRLAVAGAAAPAARDIIALLQANASTSISLKNNIFIGFAGAQVSGADVSTANLNAVTTSYNLFHLVARPYERNSASLVVEDTMDLVNVDPMVIDDELRLDAASPAVDAAPAIAFIIDDYYRIMRPIGAGPDIGAHER